MPWLSQSAVSRMAADGAFTMVEGDGATRRTAGLDGAVRLAALVECDLDHFALAQMGVHRAGAHPLNLVEPLDLWIDGTERDLTRQQAPLGVQAKRVDRIDAKAGRTEYTTTSMVPSGARWRDCSCRGESNADTNHTRPTVAAAVMANTTMPMGFITGWAMPSPHAAASDPKPPTPKINGWCSHGRNR
jgi:hypothetical protein